MHHRVSPRHGNVVSVLCKIGYTSGMFTEILDAPRAYKALYENLYR